MLCTGLNAKLNCCVLSSSGHGWCHGLTREAVLMELFSEATGMLPQCLLNRRQLLGPFSQSICASSVPFFPYNWPQVWACGEGKVFASRVPSYFFILCFFDLFRWHFWDIV